MKLSTHELVITALFTAIFCILAPMSMPIGPVPISLTGLVLYLSLYVIGCKKTVIAYIIYLILGIIGLPVFSGFTGGLGKLIGPTGGYLAGFIFTALLSGIIIDKFYFNRLLSVLGMLIGLILLYAFGTAWFCFINNGKTVYEILMLCVVPFIPFDIIKILISAFLGPVIRNKFNIDK